MNAAAQLMQARLAQVAKDRAAAEARLALAQASHTEATASIARLDAEKQSLDTALAALGA